MCVVLLRPHDFLTGAGTDHVFSLLVGLREDGAHSSGLLVISQIGICDEVEGSILPEYLITAPKHRYL